jgi:hypothetical protein
MSIDALLDSSGLDAPIRAVIDGLRVKKRTTPELGLEPRIAALDDWTLGELTRLAPAGLDLPGRDQAATAAEADQLFLRAIGM